MRKPTIALYVRLTPEVAVALGEQADAEEHSVASVVQRILAEALNVEVAK